MKNQKINSPYKKKYYKPVVKLLNMPEVDLNTTYRDLRHYGRDALLKWLIVDDQKYNLRSSKASFNRQGIASLKSEILARVKLDSSYKNIYVD